MTPRSSAPHTLEGSGLSRELSRIASYGPEYGPSLSSHVPMVIEALDRLGFGDAISPYVTAWIPRLRPLDPARDADLVTFPALREQALAAVSELGPVDALRHYATRIFPGLHGAAFHGVIRVGHAMRAVLREPSDVTRAELASALAYAEVRAGEPLARGAVPAFDGRESLVDVLESLPATTASGRGRVGLITADFEARVRTGDGAELRRASLRVGLSSRPESLGEDLLRCALALFVRGERHPSASFVLLHGLTATDAVVSLAAHLDPEDARSALASMAVALVALRLAYVVELTRASPPSSLSRVHAAALEPFETWVERAVASGDDHAIKLAAACEEGRRLDPSSQEAYARALELGVRAFA